ncbi:N-acetylmuramoyl-L-alanine amidase [Apirhabdus apintestini]|uniref:N-acetylmuramoyl-L-alanine amidase n=1 Tax=Erwinia sp. HR93 TaxID=3094840 RepID=UPI002ADEF071|nr:N-acetylmuramoyl-L-alanine amidase [Erwinia sp. HR93]MEA1064366.1 N-acetylmuramoyl-L-alanine amidase [Erwinia sp. HR93]WPM83932.1 N-acetylmuramoyl-L-alanine amidase [Enterobacteriaceae bacterium CA-0114]
MFPIRYNAYRSIKGFNQRVRYLVLHYTAQNFSDSVRSLTGDNVSIHYLIPDPDDATYKAEGYKDMNIFAMVDEQDRAWHAGISAWGNRSNLNDTAIGIEMVNLAADDNGTMIFPTYHPQQIEAVITLSKNILQRYPDISPVNIIGHSDISPGRKSDPGPAFPWQALYDAGIGAWYDECVKEHFCRRFVCEGLPAKGEIINQLSLYGYDISEANDKTGFQLLLRAFQLHFRPENYDGVLDVETAAVLYALIEKYVVTSAP